MAITAWLVDSDKSIATTQIPWGQLMDWIAKYSGAIQAISTVVLVVITAFYAYWTQRMSKKTEDMADLARAGYMNDRLPVVVVSLEDRPSPHAPFSTFERFHVTIENVGPGPAIDTVFSWSSDSLGFVLDVGPAFPLTLAPGAQCELTFRIDLDAPFPDGSGPRWPPNPAVAALENNVARASQQSLPESAKAAEKMELERSREEFTNNVRRHAASIRVAGSITINYRDVFNRKLHTTSEIRFGDQKSSGLHLPGDIVFRNLALHSRPLEFPDEMRPRQAMD